MPVRYINPKTGDVHLHHKTEIEAMTEEDPKQSMDSAYARHQVQYEEDPEYRKKYQFASIRNYMELLQHIIHEDNVQKGFWDQERNVGEALALVHSEISEALEGHRKNLPSEKIEGYDQLTEELADAIIRIMDLAGGLSLDLSDAIIEKIHHNRTRPYKHGKNY